MTEPTAHTRRPVPTPPADVIPPAEPGQSDAAHIDAIRKAHAARQHEDAAHQARMRRASAAVLGTSKGLELAKRPAVAGIITIDAEAGQWPIVIDGMPLPWYVDQAIRVDYSNEVDGLGRLWVGILAEAIHVDQMPYPDRRHQSERERLYKDLNAKGLEAAAWRTQLEQERDNHDQTISRLTRTRRRLARVHQAATRLATERDEARMMAMRAETALTSLASNQATLALAVVEAGGAGVAVPGDIDLQATLTIRRLLAELGTRDAQIAGMTAERDARDHEVALELITIDAGARARIVELEEQLADMTAERDALAAQRDDARTVADSASQQVGDAIARIGRLDDASHDELDRLTDQRDALHNEVERLAARIADLEPKANHLDELFLKAARPNIRPSYTVDEADRMLVRGRPDDPQTLAELVGQLTGAASVCWIGGPIDLEFNATRASQLVDEALAWIDEHYVPLEDLENAQAEAQVDPVEYEAAQVRIDELKAELKARPAPPTVAEALEATRARAQTALDARTRIAALEDDARRRDDAEVAELAYRRAHETD